LMSAYAMHQSVPHADNGTPGDPRMLLTRVHAHPACSFARDLDRVGEGKDQHLVCVRGLRGVALL
jgi:hypothetical protein